MRLSLSTRSASQAPLGEQSWLRFLGAYLAPHRRKFALLTTFLLGGVALQLLGPQLIRAFIDTASADGAEGALVRLALLYLGVAIANQVLTALATYFGQDVGWAATNRLREDLTLHTLRLDMTFHNTRTPGELVERIDGDLTALSNFFSIFLINIVGSALLLLGAIVILFGVDWRMGLGMALFSALTLAVLLLLRRFAVPAGVQERETSARFLGFIEERLAGVEDIRANGGGDYTMYRFYEAMRAWFTKGVRAWLRRSSIWTVTGLLFMLSTALVFGVSAALYFSHAITLGVAYLFFQYNLLLQNPLEQLTQQMQEFQRAASSIERAQELLRIQPRIVDGVDGAAAEPVTSTGATSRAPAPEVVFDGVTFAYAAGERPVLREIAFRLAPGQTLGLLGRTGSGKTTISRLLFRLYDVSEGAIRLDGVDIRELSLAALRRRIGLVTQDVQLFHASVRDNLTFFDPTVPDARLLEVIEAMGLTGWFARLPRGLDTELETGGAGLSAGESQLLAFIRVFLKDPGLVILDEPSSRLDPATEATLERGMRLLLKDRTGIVIAHRLATVQRADTILVLDNGRMLEFGPRATLASNPDSRFAELLRVGLEDGLERRAEQRETTGDTRASRQRQHRQEARA